jgi:glyoxylase-like metal-dependent hydrolase (beta-lactamase superfamily II)
MRLQQTAAPGIHRVEDAHTNWYLVEGDGRLTIVDAGVPRSWPSLKSALRELGRNVTEIDAIVVTHAHFDHLGFAERARRTLGIPVWVHENDAALARHPLQYGHDRSRIPYLLNPNAAPLLGRLVAAGAFFVPGVREVTRYSNGALPVPGAPRVVATPGHTLGHCALHFPDRDAVIAGDAVVMLDPYTARRGPRIVAGAATADPERALASLDALAETEATTVLTGHGEPWVQGAAAAAEHARRIGVS